MTREEQINLYLKEHNIPITSLEANSIIEGIEWADANPNLYNNEKYHTVKVSCLDELNKKAVLYDAFPEKACEWLEQHKDDYFEYDPWKDVYVNFNALIADFKKSMEK